MKKIILCSFFALILAAHCRGDEIIKNNGEILIGTIEETLPNHYVKIEVKRTYKVKWDNIKEINGKVVPPLAKARRRKREFYEKSWYLNPVELGFAAAMAYPPKMDALLDRYRNLPVQKNEIRFSISEIGVYFPVGAAKRTLLGFVLDEGTADGIFQANNQWQVNQLLLYSLSGMYFLHGKIGDGLYVKGNLGLASIDFSGYGGYNEDGLGVSAELGYVFPVWDVLRPLVNVNYAFKDVGAGEQYVASGIYQSLSLNFGILW